MFIFALRPSALVSIEGIQPNAAGLNFHFAKFDANSFIQRMPAAFSVLVERAFMSASWFKDRESET